MTSPQEPRSKAAAIMPELLADLEHLVSIPSVAFPGYPPEPVGIPEASSMRVAEAVNPSARGAAGPAC